MEIDGEEDIEEKVTRKLEKKDLALNIHSDLSELIGILKTSHPS